MSGIEIGKASLSLPPISIFIPTKFLNYFSGNQSRDFPRRTCRTWRIIFFVHNFFSIFISIFKKILIF